MNLIQKFCSDIERIKKHNRDSSGKLNVSIAKNQIVSLFENNNRHLGELPHSLTDYWLSEYVEPELSSGAKEFSNETIDKLCAMYAFLTDDEDTDSLNEKDWQKIGEAVNYEAEDLPMDTLSSLMKTLVDKKAY